MNNIFIIGNGFDLDLGWKTRYSDFANSKFWPDNAEKSRPILQIYLEAKNNISAWFDIENELLNYANINDIRHGDALTLNANPQKDIEYFKDIHKALTAYLKEQQRQPILKDSIAAQVLDAIYKNGYFSSIYSFNYTSLNAIAKSIGIEQDFSYTHIHGSIEENSIIVGVDETPLIKGFEEFHKTISPHYRSHNIFADLQAANEVVFFGISFGKIDYSYFDRFFQSQTDRSMPDNKKHITIFTYDEKSRIEILTSLANMGINRQHLFSQCEFQIIRTSSPDDKPLIEAFTKRLNENSKATFEKNLENLEAFLH